MTWSPDGKYVVTGGQDDLVSIWSLNERQIVARCPGHDSWVTAVAFDPWRCDDKTYRFGTVGEDCKLLLWDFNVGMLHRPKGVSGSGQAYSTYSDTWQAVGRTRGSISTQSTSLARHRTESASVVNRNRSDSNRTQSMHQPQLDEDAEFINHPVEPRSRTAQLPPVLSRKVDEHSLTGLAFEQDCIITSCQEGKVMYTVHVNLLTWSRACAHVESSQRRDQQQPTRFEHQHGIFEDLRLTMQLNRTVSVAVGTISRPAGDWGPYFSEP